MNTQTQDIIRQCAMAAHEDTMRFPEIVQKLADAGTALYHADFLRAETTYYLTNGESLVVALQLPPEPLAARFDTAGVAAAVQASQQEGIAYVDFLQRALRAGCCGYSVYILGRRVMYLGIEGDVHIEYFPGSAPQSIS